MKILIALFSFLSVVNYCTAQPKELTFEEWQIEATTNKRLLPRYGHLPKTEQELEADAKFISVIKSQKDFTTMRESSNHLVKLGFDYLYRGDVRTAMYRFNQAYLLDSTNTDDYWGYGAVYIQLGELERAAEQYKTGLALDSTNAHIWTDYATLFMIKFGEDGNPSWLDTAIRYLHTSYSLQPKDVNTCYKLSTGYFRKGSCVDAWKYYNECVALGGQPITEEYTNALKKCY